MTPAGAAELRVEELAAIHAECFTTPRPWNAGEFAEMLARPGVIVFREDGGFILGSLAGPEAEVLTLAVRPGARRRGIAGRLLDNFVGHARNLGVSDIFLEVAADNRPARGLYLKHGFQEAGNRRDYYAGINGQKVSAIVMRRALGAVSPP